MTNFEDVVLGKIKSFLPETFHISTSISPVDGLYPDAVIYYKKTAVAVVEVKKRLDQNSVMYARLQLESYAQRFGIGFMVVCSDDVAIRLYDDPAKGEERLDIETLVKKYILPMAKEDNLSKEDAIKLKKELIDKSKTVNLTSSNLSFLLDSLTNDELMREVTITANGDVLLSESLETKIFKSLLGTFNSEKVCRYTSLSSTIRILKSQKASVCGIACMNDKSECYYVDQYLNGSNAEQLLCEMSDSEIRELNQYFIMSCSDIQRLDKLTMWRMYGSEAKGCCMTYKVNEIMDTNDSFYIAPISYAKEDGTHPELDFIKEVVNGKFLGKRIVLQSLNLWKHFFKPYDYADECEIRLLYREEDNNKYQWITTGDDILCPIVEFEIRKDKNEFPLTIERIMLGPKCPERYTNVAQLNYYASLKNLASVDDRIHFSISKIDNYR